MFLFYSLMYSFKTIYSMDEICSQLINVYRSFGINDKWYKWPALKISLHGDGHIYVSD